MRVSLEILDLKFGLLDSKKHILILKIFIVTPENRILKPNLIFLFLGVAPNVVGCGSHDFSDLSSLEICKKLENLKSQNDSCIPVLETQFESVNYEVRQRF